MGIVPVAYLCIDSGAVCNIVSLTEGKTTAKIFVKKGDYTTRFSSSYYGKNKNFQMAGGGVNGKKYGIYGYAKQTVNVVAPPDQGVTVGCIRAGTYTLHQSGKIDGYAPAEDSQITVKDSSKVEDMQQITLVNKKDPAHVHTYSDRWSKDTEQHWHQATCEHKIRSCSRIKLPIAMEWHVVKASTTELEGLRESACNVCGYA